MNALIDTEQQILLEKSKLTQLLDYIAFQESGGNKTPYQIPLNSYLVDKLKSLSGLTLSNDKQTWFSIKRLEAPEEIPELPEYLKYYLLRNDDGIVEYIEKGLKELIALNPIKSSKLFYTSDVRPLKKAFEVLRYCKEFFSKNEAWANSNISTHRSVKFYDQLFYWYNTVNVGMSVENTEIVAGFGMVQCRLPSGKLYRYPLITIPIELDVDANGVITVGPKDTLPRIEFDAFLQEASYSSSGLIKNDLKEMVGDERFFDVFDSETFVDATNHFVASIDSRAGFVENIDDVAMNDQITVSNTCLIFARPHISSVINDDVEALKHNLNLPETAIPEQPRSLITPLSDGRKINRDIAFRSMSGVDGQGSEVVELYFPLPSNKEQVMIARNIELNSGVVVQGPAGTGKTHTIANIVSHCLATGKKVLVTAQQAHVLNTIHEKLPEEIRHLVISRIGNSQQSKRQLESSIDHILQNLSQINEADLEREIKETLALVDVKHQTMKKLDEEMLLIAQKHQAVLHLNGVDYTVPELTKYLRNKDEKYDWFDVELNPMHSDFNAKIPTHDEYQAVKESRLNLRDLLKDFGRFNQFEAEMPDETSINELTKSIIKQKSWGLKFNWLNIESMQFDRKKIHDQKTALDAHKNKLEKIINQYSWVSSYLNIALRSKVEYQFLNELIRDEISELIAYRKELLRNPVNIPFEIEQGSKEWESINRAAETGVLVPWYHFDNKLRNKLMSITLSGQAPENYTQWVVVQKYIKNKQIYNAIAVKWNAAVEGKKLFELDFSTNPTLMKLLSVLDERIQAVTDLNKFHTDTKNLISQNFTDIEESNKDIDLWLNLSKFKQIYEYFDQVDQAYKISDQRSELLNDLEQILENQAQLDKPIYKLSEIEECLRNILQGEFVEKNQIKYLSVLKQIESFNSSSKDYEVISKFSDKINLLGAYKLAEDIKLVPCLDMLEDPATPDDLLSALDWARVYNHLKQINNYAEIEAYYKKRKKIENELAQHYKKLATKKTWLSLKQDASDKTLVCLNRYKISVQKIGKGTGKNAPRYRKDAQNALLEASKAIPCWIMSHSQVSESMPAEIGMFDLVIIDEASQSTIIDALPVLMRAKKILVVGDNKQVSPSSNGTSSEQIKFLRDKHLYGQPHRDFLTPDQSLYDMSSSIYDSSVMLLEHFRCHPNIIAYSNSNYYDNKIKPMRISKNSERLVPALQPIYVEDGVRETKSSKHINRAEARAIIAEIENIIREIRSNPNSNFKGKTIGAISLLGAAQAEFIQTQALDAFGAEILSMMKFACGEASSFQGAERDIIFLSMVADPENCYPISGIAYEQRLNVAASRAKEKMYLVHSVKSNELSQKDLRLPLMNYFYTTQEEEPEERYSSIYCKTDFELDVFNTLTEMGYRVKPKQAVGGYTIDLVVESLADDRLAIECDGDDALLNWHDDSSKQRDLERSGWVFWRCFWSTWILDRDAMLQAIIDKLESLNIYPINK